ncbi:hypothetical protein HKBW3S03_02061, partial [Candidatus Hakubella thermalkaliphila]
GTFTNVHAALQETRKHGVGNRVVVVVTDTGER